MSIGVLMTSRSQKKLFRFLQGQDVGNDDQYKNEYRHELQEKIQDLFTGLIIEPQIEGIRPVPLDKGCIIGKPRHVGPGTQAGKERISYIEFLRDGHIHMVGFFKNHLKVIVPERCDV